MNGVVFGDFDGIAFNIGGTLVVENSVIAGFGVGINQAAAGSNLIVSNCEFRNNHDGIRNITGSATNSNTVIENSRFEYHNSYGVRGESGTANISIRNSVFANSFGGVLAFSPSQTQPVLIIVDTCTIAHNFSGILAEIGVAVKRHHPRDEFDHLPQRGRHGDQRHGCRDRVVRQQSRPRQREQFNVQRHSAAAIERGFR